MLNRGYVMMEHISQKNSKKMSMLLGVLIAFSAVQPTEGSFTKVFALTSLGLGIGYAFINYEWHWGDYMAKISAWLWPDAYAQKPYQSNSVSTSAERALHIQHPNSDSSRVSSNSAQRLLERDAQRNQFIDGLAFAHTYLPEDNNVAIHQFFIGNHRVYGWEKQVTRHQRRENRGNRGNQRGVILKQPIVANQSARNNNRGGAASCGYHSFKNFCVVAQALKGRISFDAGKALLSVDLVNELFRIDQNPQNHGILRQQVLNHISGTGGNGDMISERDINQLITMQSRPGGLLDGIPAGCCVIEDLLRNNMKGPEASQAAEYQYGSEAFYNEQSAALVQAKNLIESGIDVYGFIINDVHEGCSAGHWFTLVVYQSDSIRHYIILDSCNSNRFENQSLRKLMTTLGD